MAEQKEKLRVAQLERMKRKRRSWGRAGRADVKVIEGSLIDLGSHR